MLVYISNWVPLYRLYLCQLFLSFNAFMFGNNSIPAIGPGFGSTWGNPRVALRSPSGRRWIVCPTASPHWLSEIAVPNYHMSVYI